MYLWLSPYRKHPRLIFLILCPPQKQCSSPNNLRCSRCRQWCNNNRGLFKPNNRSRNRWTNKINRNPTTSLASWLRLWHEWTLTPPNNSSLKWTSNNLRAQCLGWACQEWVWDNNSNLALRIPRNGGGAEPIWLLKSKPYEAQPVQYIR